MTIQALRILPPLAIARLGSAPVPLDNFTAEVDPETPLDFRRIVPQETLLVDEQTGEITKSWTPTQVVFKDDGKIRPVAPFLEVFAQTSPDTLEPLTLDLLAREGLAPGSITWSVSVANRKVARRTGHQRDVVLAELHRFSDHESHELEGHCENFVSPSAFIRFGAVRYIKPNTAFPQIRLRFTPAQGLIYGANKVNDKILDEHKWLPKERRVYDARKGWYGFEVPHEVEKGAGRRRPGQRFWNETLPPSLFAIAPPAPPWLHGSVAISRGYLDDACDGIVTVALRTKAGKSLTGAARITSAPPMLVPDARFVRSLADDLEQVISGPNVPPDEPLEVTRARAEEILRRAYETVRFLNVVVMNGEPYQGRSPLDFDTMPAEEAFDTNRLMRPVMAEGSVDTLAVMALHQQVFAALRGGAAPWFVRLLRRPDAVTDFTDDGRRKMPALMCGADGSYLALTHHQISTIERVAEAAPFQPPSDGATETVPDAPLLTPRNLTAQIAYAVAGNPASSRPSSAIANCCPGLEVDFRAVWRRIFKGIVLREYDNLVVATDADVPDPVISGLAGHRLLRVNGVETTGTMVGPSPADPAQPVVLATDDNPHGLAPFEWSNLLAAVLGTGKAICDFTKEESWYQHQPWTGRKGDHITVELEVRSFFESDTAVISHELAQPGELTQGLCSPWQNDFRECSCYYWASARPDFVNVEPGPTGGSTGDNWLQKVRTGAYLPDDYADDRLLNYDDLFESWELWLRFQIGGRDSPGEIDGRA